MSDTVDWIKRLVDAWDCCGTCAGGVLGERDRAIRAQTLRGFGNAIATPRPNQDGPTLYSVWLYANRLADDIDQPTASTWQEIV